MLKTKPLGSLVTITNMHYSIFPCKLMRDEHYCAIPFRLYYWHPSPAGWKEIYFLYIWLCIQITEFKKKKTWLVTITRSYSKHFNSIALFSLPSYLILFLLLFLIVLLLLSFLQEDCLISWPGVFLKENRSEKELGSGHSIRLSCGHLCVCHMYIPG